MSTAAVLIFGMWWPLSPDSDPKCFHRSVQNGTHRLHRQFFQNQNPAPAQQRSVHLEGWILSGRSNQSYRPALDMGKESVLCRGIHKREKNKKQNKNQLLLRFGKEKRMDP